MSACLAVGFVCATFAGAFADNDSRDRASASGFRGLVDLSHPLNEQAIYWPTAKRWKLTKVAEGETEGGYYYASNDFEASEHGGTHLDAPLRRLVGGAVVVDVSRKALRNRDYLITPADFAGWERRNGRIKRGSIVLLRTGFERYWPDAEKYLGTAERGEAAVPKLHFPGLSEAGAQWLVRESRIKAVGIDTASIDYGQSTDFLAHRVLGGSNTPIFENVDRLSGMPSRGFTVVALPMKIEGGTGGPVRIMAVMRP